MFRDLTRDGSVSWGVIGILDGVARLVVATDRTGHHLTRLILPRVPLPDFDGNYPKCHTPEWIMCILSQRAEGSIRHAQREGEVRNHARSWA